MQHHVVCKQIVSVRPPFASGLIGFWTLGSNSDNGLQNLDKEVLARKTGQEGRGWRVLARRSGQEILAGGAW